MSLYQKMKERIFGKREQAPKPEVRNPEPDCSEASKTEAEAAGVRNPGHWHKLGDEPWPGEHGEDFTGGSFNDFVRGR
jgi:hypothetical protein